MYFLSLNILSLEALGGNARGPDEGFRENTKLSGINAFASQNELNGLSYIGLLCPDSLYLF